MAGQQGGSNVFANFQAQGRSVVQEDEWVQFLTILNTKLNYLNNLDNTILAKIATLTGLVGLLKMTVFKSVELSASGNTAVWTPSSSSKKFNLMYYKIQVTGDATMASAGRLVIGLQDATTDLGISHEVFVDSTANNNLEGYDSGWQSLGQGILSSTAGNVLNGNLSAALTAGKVRIIVAGTEQ